MDCVSDDDDLEEMVYADCVSEDAHDEYSWTTAAEDARGKLTLPVQSWETKRLLVWINSLPAGRFHFFPHDVIFGSTGQLVQMMIEFKRF